MKYHNHKIKYCRSLNGSVLLITIFVIALLSTLVIGILQMNIEDLQLVQNHICATQALMSAEAGLNDAFKEIRANSSWNTGFTNKAFNGGSYTVNFDGSTIISTAISDHGFAARVQADITIGTTSPYIIKIDNFRINE